MQRLDKIVALNCNISRKDAHKLIKDGAVRVNGILQTDVSASTDENASVTVNGRDISVRKNIYIMMNKPQGVICATEDRSIPTVIDILPDELRRRNLFPAGRLDRDTTGLLIITDDGDFAHRLMSPAHHVWKTYIAGLDHPMGEEHRLMLEEGAHLDDGTDCLPAKVHPFDENGPKAEIKIREGRYHQVKRMVAAGGNKCVSLRRVSIGALKLDSSLPEGECREMAREEAFSAFEE